MERGIGSATGDMMWHDMTNRGRHAVFTDIKEQWKEEKGQTYLFAKDASDESVRHSDIDGRVGGQHLDHPYG